MKQTDTIKAHKDAALQLISDYKYTFGTVQGKRVLQNLSDKFLRVLDIPDPITAGASIGRHQVITYIQDKLVKRESDIEMMYREDDDDGE